MRFPNNIVTMVVCLLSYKLLLVDAVLCEAMQNSNITPAAQSFVPSPNNSPGSGAISQTEQILGITLEPTVAVVEESVSNPQNFIVDLHSQFTPEHGCLDILEANYQLNDQTKEYINKQ